MKDDSKLKRGEKYGRGKTMWREVTESSVDEEGG